MSSKLFLEMEAAHFHTSAMGKLASCLADSLIFFNELFQRMPL